MDTLEDEVDALEAILMDDVRFERCAQTGAVKCIESTVFPQMGEAPDEHQICVTLRVLPTPGYPSVSPSFELLRPRGLDDARLGAIRAACNAKLVEAIGTSVVFDLIEIVREQLTASSLPSGQCVICLYGFAEDDEYTRTECFHYLHSYCLARHLNASRRAYQEEHEKLPPWLRLSAEPYKPVCPVCRNTIKDDDATNSLKCALPPAELQNAPEFRLTRELRELQQHMSKLYLHQKSRGAIIDVEADAAPIIATETPEEARCRQEREQAEALRKMEAAAAKAEAAAAKAAASAAAKKRNKQSAEHTQNSSSTSTPPEPNRRHYRGGRRHQQHLHHHHHNHQQREREPVPAAEPKPNAASTTPTVAGNGKQTKAHVAGGTRVR